MASHDITSRENNAMFGEITAWNVFDADGYNAMGYTREMYVDAGLLPDE
jgi:hypothetical protein